MKTLKIESEVEWGPCDTCPRCGRMVQGDAQHWRVIHNGQAYHTICAILSH